MALEGVASIIFAFFPRKKFWPVWGSNSWQIQINGYKSIEQTNDSETDTIYKDHWFPTAEIPWQPIHKQSWVCVCQRKFRNSEKVLTQAGLEPTISCSVGRRLIHWATEPWWNTPDFSIRYLTLIRESWKNPKHGTERVFRILDVFSRNCARYLSRKLTDKSS